MATNDNRSRILADLKTTFESITTANGYKTDVANVEQLAKVWTQVGPAYRPWIGVSPGIVRLGHQPGGVIRCTFRIEVIGLIAAGTPSARSDALNDLLDDILTAVQVDTTRGEDPVNAPNRNATMTTVVEFQTDEGDIEDRQDGGILRAALEVVYFRTTSAST